MLKNAWFNAKTVNYCVLAKYQLLGNKQNLTIASVILLLPAVILDFR